MASLRNCVWMLYNVQRLNCDFFFNSFLVAVSVLNQTIRSRGKKGMISPKEFFDNDFPCQYQRKCVMISMGNMHTVSRMWRVDIASTRSTTFPFVQWHRSKPRKMLDKMILFYHINIVILCLKPPTQRREMTKIIIPKLIKKNFEYSKIHLSLEVTRKTHFLGNTF